MSKNKSIKTRSIVTTIKRWIKNLKTLEKHVELHSEATLKAKRLQTHNIDISNLNLEKDTGSPFFAPLPGSSLTYSGPSTALHLISPTSEDGKVCESEYDRGKAFANTLPTRMLDTIVEIGLSTKIGGIDKEKYQPAKWTSTSDSLMWSVCDAFSISETKPHMMLTLVSDCKADNKSLAKSELVTITSFLRVSLGIEMLKKKKSSRQHYKPSHMICPILIFSVFNCLQARIIEAYVDGNLKIRYSQLYNFDKLGHRNTLNLFIRWMIPRAHGTTFWSPPLPALIEDDAEEKRQEEEDWLSDDSKGSGS